MPQIPCSRIRTPERTLNTRLKKSGAYGYLQRLTGGNHFTPIVMAAMAADVVRALQLTAVRAFSESLDAECFVAATHTTTRRRSFSFGYSHEPEPLPAKTS
jgi:hypothetical protein